jgi:hypothetical protein
MIEALVKHENSTGKSHALPGRRRDGIKHRRIAAIGRISIGKRLPRVQTNVSRSRQESRASEMPRGVDAEGRRDGQPAQTTRRNGRPSLSGLANN